MAIGDICLMTEAQFQPYFRKTMETLIQAGQMSIAPIDQNLPVEDKKNFHDLRQALIDAFMSIINGIKSPRSGDDRNLANSDDIPAPNSFEDLTFDQIKNMFYYVEKLMSLDDLNVNSEIAKQILDLYCDIIMLQVSDPTMTQNHNLQAKAMEFSDQIKRSNVHNVIQTKFGPYVDLIN